MDAYVECVLEPMPDFIPVSPFEEMQKGDIDRLVIRALIPERSRTRPVREQPESAFSLSAEWDATKQQWK